MSTFNEVILLVSEFPGNLVYHLVLLGWLMMAAALALNNADPNHPVRSLRLALAVIGLFTLQLFHFLIVVLSHVALFEPLYVLPPLDRTIALLSIVLTLWAFAFPEPSRLGDSLTSLLLLSGLIAAVVAQLLWREALNTNTVVSLCPTQSDQIIYNCTTQEAPWEIAKMILLGGGLLLLVIRRRDQWALASLYILLLLVGYGIHNFRLASATNVPGVERLAELLALPFLTTLVYQRVLFTVVSAPDPSPISLPEPLSGIVEPPSPVEVLAPPTPPRIDSKAAVALASFNTVTNHEELIQIITLGLAQTFQVDLCLFLDPPDHLAGPRLAGGYNRLTEQVIEERPFMLSETPGLSAALNQSRPTLLSSRHYADDLRRLARAVGHDPSFSAMVLPLRHEAGPVLGAVLLIAARHDWADDERNLLVALGEAAAASLNIATRSTQMQDDLVDARDQHVEVQQALQTAQAELAHQAVVLVAAQTEAQRLSTDLTHAQDETERLRTAQADLTRRLQAQPSTEMAQVHLMGELNDMRHKLLVAQHEAEEAARLESELDQALERVEALAQFENQLETTQRELEEYRQQESDLRIELKQIRADWAAAQANAPDMAVQTAQLTQAQEHVATLMAELTTVQTNLVEITAAYAAAQERERQWQIELEQAETQRQQLDTAQTQVQQLQQELETTRATLEQLQAAGATLTVTQVDLSQAQAQAQQAEAMIAQLQAELEQARVASDTLAQTQTNLAQVQNREAQLIRDLEQLRAEIAHTTLTLTHAEAQTQQLRQELAHAQTLPPLLQATQMALAETATSLARAQAQENQLRQELEQLRQTPPSGSVLQSDLDQARSDMNKAISQRMALAVQLDDKHRALATLQEALEANESELVALRQESGNQITQLQQEVKRLREQLERSGTQPLTRLKRTGLLGPIPEKLPKTASGDQEVIHSLTQELRQPISSIGGYADLLLNESAGILGALQRKFLERIKASTERMGVLLDDLIHVTAAESGTLEFKAEHLDVGDVIEEALTTSAAHFRERGIELALNIMPDLPALNADRDAIRQIFAHLLNNAVAASQPDSVVTLTVRREADPSQRIGDAMPYLFIAVQDTGGGIAPEDQPRVFSRLYRADAPLVAGVGDTGVGLSMVKTLVEAHQGKVWVVSEAGVGSTFNILLPIDRSAPKINGALPSV